MKKIFFIVLVALSLNSFGQVPSYVPSIDLVAWYPFNGNANDESTNSNKCTVNGPSLTTDRFGKIDSAYLFDGVDDFIETTTNLISNDDSSWSISLWFYLPAYSPDNATYQYDFLVSDRRGNSWEQKYLIAIKDSVYYAGTTKNGTASQTFTDTVNYNLENQWHHIVYVFNWNSKNKQYFVDGVLANTDTLLDFPSTNKIQETVFGARKRPKNEIHEFFKGILDDIGFWNRALTFCEIQNLHHGALSPILKDIQTACDSFQWIDGNTYTSNNNTATHTLTNSSGCDSIVILDLTIINSSSSTDIQTACDSFEWIDGNTYTSSNNTATHTLMNSAGCDSIVILDLTIINSSSSTDIQTACDSFEWIDGNTYTSSNNTATHTLTNSVGCDSIVMLDLTINTVDNSVTQSGNKLTANASGSTYQWLNCENDFSIITGETNQNFTAKTNGIYAVEVSQDGCIDTSVCHSISSVGVFNISLVDEFFIYPNPMEKVFSILLDKDYQSVTITITNLYGKIIYSNSYHNRQLINLELEESIGVYFLIIDAGKGRRIMRLVKQ